jgi:hypothetical protein
MILTYDSYVNQVSRPVRPGAAPVENQCEHADSIFLDRTAGAGIVRSAPSCLFAFLPFSGQSLSGAQLGERLNGLESGRSGSRPPEADRELVAVRSVDGPHELERL